MEQTALDRARRVIGKAATEMGEDQFVGLVQWLRFDHYFQYGQEGRLGLANMSDIDTALLAAGIAFMRIVPRTFERDTTGGPVREDDLPF